MSRHRYFRKVRSEHPIKGSTQQFLLDQFSIADIRKWQATQDEVLKFYWDFYSNLAYERSKIIDQIKIALLEAAERDYQFKHWQRLVKYKYALEPFSVAGSLIDPGGRFNIGGIKPEFPCFPALYIAADKDTALQELLSQQIVPGKESQALDYALTNPESITNVSLSGKLDSIINLRHPKKLQPFVNLIKDFKIPKHLKAKAKKIGFPPLSLIRTVSRLMETLSDPNWRVTPMQFDVPASSQIFGQLVSAAGIDGIMYASKFNGKDCLAIFPHNFSEPSESYIQLDDEAPAGIKNRRLDAKIWGEHQK